MATLGLWTLAFLGQGTERGGRGGSEGARTSWRTGFQSWLRCQEFDGLSLVSSRVWNGADQDYTSEPLVRRELGLE